MVPRSSTALVVFVSLLVAASVGLASAGKHEHMSPTYFRRKNENGNFINVGGEGFHVPFRDQGFVDLQEGSGATLTAWPAVVRSGEEVVVSFDSVPNATLDDFIGLFCPSTGTNDTNYIDWMAVSVLTRQKDAPKASGEGVMMLRDTREVCDFRYFTPLRAGGGYAKVATSNTVVFKKGQPLHGHIALTGDITEMRVMWNSNDGVAAPFVAYGTSENSLTDKVQGTSHTYTNTDMCNFPANTSVAKGGGFIEPGFMHEAVLVELTPGKRYFYSYGQSAEDMSRVMSFVASPETNPDYNFSFVVYADMGTYTNTRADTTADTSLQLVNEGCELVIHAGDISYARGIAYLWDQWHQIVEPYATKVPYMVGIGNHEYDHLELGQGKDPSGAAGVGFHPEWGNYGDDSHGECGVPTYNRFTMPGNGNALFWYSFDYGSVHFIMLSTEHNITEGSPQHTFLAKDLESVDRKRTPWVIVQGHRPMYNSEDYTGDFKVSLGQRRMYEDLLLKHSVDLAWYGHYHAYERVCPVNNGKCVPHGQGPVHFTIGSAGYNGDGSTLLNKSWSMFEDNAYGIAKVTVANQTALHWEYIRNEDGVVADEVWIYKEGHGTRKTASGCTCKQPWQGADTNANSYECQNPDADPKGNWCKVVEESCGRPASVGAKGTGRWDYCAAPTRKTKNGCVCQSPFWAGDRKYYGCSYVKTTYEWCYVNEGCGTEGAGGRYWDKC